MARSAVTFFSWGYRGWGSSTKQFVRAADAVERTLGFRPPYFVDIRLRRSGRASGFVGYRFAYVAGQRRHKWMQSLGNMRIRRKTGPPIQIKNPKAASALLDLTLDCAKRRQRIIFFCQCKYPHERGRIMCHRAVVASLVLKEARRRGIKAEVVEWPGGSQRNPIDLQLTEAEAIKIKRGKASLDLGQDFPSPTLSALPWGSIARLKSAQDRFLVIVGAARHRNGGWFLPVIDKGDVSELSSLRRQSERERKAFGLTPRQV
jgi:hypothetical protein